MTTAILIADDDPMILRLLRRVLEKSGYVVHGADSGPSALEILRTEHPPIIITDWMMPGMDGLELCREIRRDPGIRHTYVIMLTACTGSDALIMGLEAGADEYVTKPFVAEELLVRVRVGERLLGYRSEVEALTARMDGDLTSVPGEVLGIIGHELKTPISSIRATSEFLITDECRNSGDLDVFLRNVHDGIVQLGQMVDDLLESARLRSGAAAWNWDEIALGQTIDEALDAIRPLLDNTAVRLESMVEPSDLCMRGDPAAIQRLVVNLVNNARRHTKAGMIRIVAHAADHGPGRWIRLGITDTGCGFDPEVLDRTGRPFALNKGVVSRGGSAATGLGLFICRRISQAHGGSISFASRPGEGTTVQVLLRSDLAGPVAADRSAA